MDKRANDIQNTFDLAKIGQNTILYSIQLKNLLNKTLKRKYSVKFNRFRVCLCDNWQQHKKVTR